MRTPALLGTAALALSSAVLAFGGQAVAADNPVVGHVYQPTNDAAGNAVAVYDRYADGSLEPAGSVPTGGLGTGASLGSQGAIARDGRLLFVVNAGDDTISALSTRGGDVTLTDRISSGGDRPVSITVARRRRLRAQPRQRRHRRASPTTGPVTSSRLPGSRRELTPNPAGGLTDAAQVQFSPNGRTLVVSEKAANAIDTFRVRAGYAGQATSHASAGTVPYGFDFDRRGTLVVSEAATGSASSYRVAPGFRNLTEALADTQAAACWLVVSGDYAWVVNAASASISSYRIAADGSLDARRRPWRPAPAPARPTPRSPPTAAASTCGCGTARSPRSPSARAAA